MAAAGLLGPQHVPVPGGEVITSIVDEVVSRTLSTATSSPGRLGAAEPAYVADLRAALTAAAAPAGRFDERLDDARLEIWRKPGDASAPG